MMTIGTVAFQLGISPDVLRKWESRHGWPVPSRTTGGTRLYDEQHLSLLQTAKRLIDSGYPVATAFALARKNDVGAHQRFQVSTAIEHLLALVDAGDLAMLRSELLAMCQSQDHDVFVETYAAPLMRAIGHAWSAGYLRVWQEHAISAIMREVLFVASFNREQARPTDPLIALLTTPPGERHTLGLSMARLMLQAEGVVCIELGAETPLEEVAVSAQDCGADIVGLSISRSYPARAAQAFSRALRTALSPDCALWLGGSGASRKATGTYNIEVCCDADTIRRYVARRWPRCSAVAGRGKNE